MSAPRLGWIVGCLAATLLTQPAWGTKLETIGSTEASAMGAASLIGRTPRPDATLTLSVQSQDYAYWSAPGVSDRPAPSAARLDQFGGNADRVNAANSTIAPAAVAISASAGKIAITLANPGINRVDLAVPNDARVYRVTLTNAGALVPTALIINVTGDPATVSSWDYDLRPLGPGAILFDFPASATASLETLIPDSRSLAPLATIDMSGAEVDRAPLAYDAIGHGDATETGMINPP
jgi:hypothetical protein